jgi:acetyl esterase/lipase
MLATTQQHARGERVLVSEDRIRQTVFVDQLLPVLQLLEVPALDLTLATARHAAATLHGPYVRSELQQAVRHYVDDADKAASALASPLLATDLHGLPPAVILTAAYDQLHEDGERYAGRLVDAGVPARVVRHRGALHGTAMLTRTWPPAAAWQHEAATALVDAHWPDAGMGEAGSGDAARPDRVTDVSEEW